MSMLACTRRRLLPRPFAFSTSSTARNVLNELATMLHVEGDAVSPIIPKTGHIDTSHSDQRFNRFKRSQVISPADFTYQSRTYESKRSKRSDVAPPSATCRLKDPFYQLDLDPRDFTTNFIVLSEYLSEMGKIQGRARTHLTTKNQRLLAKTIRRAKMMGIIPHLSILPAAIKVKKRRQDYS